MMRWCCADGIAGGSSPSSGSGSPSTPPARHGSGGRYSSVGFTQRPGSSGGGVRSQWAQSPSAAGRAPGSPMLRAPVEAERPRAVYMEDLDDEHHSDHSAYDSSPSPKQSSASAAGPYWASSVPSPTSPSRGAASPHRRYATHQADAVKLRTGVGRRDPHTPRAGA
jgi:hypothetical protein